MQYVEIEQLAVKIGSDVGEALAEAGWKIPVYIVALDVDGSMAFVKFEALGQPARTLARHSEGQGVGYPVILFAKNEQSKVARLAVTENAVGNIVLLD